MKRLAVAVLLGLLGGHPAYADKPPLDLSRLVIDLNGKPVPDSTQLTPADPNCEKCAPLTLANAVVRALLTTLDSDKTGDPMQAVARFMLAQKILANPAAVTLTMEEIVVLKNRIGKSWPSLVTGQAVLALDPGFEPPKLQ